jgi:hypothetical protein
MSIKFDPNDYLPRLQNELGYSSAEAEFAILDLSDADELIQKEFLNWWNTGQVSELMIEGYTVERLNAEHSMNPIAAFLTLDWLLKEPDVALKSLSHGHDVIL